MSDQRNFHIVKAQDTLAKIARDNKSTVSELMRINGIKNPNKITLNQRIALRKEAACGVQALFLDADRNPIEGLNYQFEYCNKTARGLSRKGGLSQRILTETPEDFVRIRIQRLNGTWKHAATIISGFGNKLVTLVSGHLLAKASTEQHPGGTGKNAPNSREKPKPAHAPMKPPVPNPTKSKSGPATQTSKTPDGKAITIVEGDLPRLDDFLDPFNGELMTDDDFKWAAKELGVDEAAIRAYAEVESGGGGFILLGKRRIPKILYERHYFSRRTNHRFSAENPDISLPSGYYVPQTKYIPASHADKSDPKQPGGAVPDEVSYYRQIRKSDGKEAKDHAVTLDELLMSGRAKSEIDKYLLGLKNYKRLVKAYDLSPNAALESCSWGAFQIMGENWKQMGYPSVVAFTKAMSRSEKEQIKAFVLYIKFIKPQIIGFIKKEQWAEAAYAYNGPSYKQNRYDELMKAAYEKYRKSK